jgi:hypothetical protein
VEKPAAAFGLVFAFVFAVAVVFAFAFCRCLCLCLLPLPLSLPFAVALASEIGPGFSPDNKASKCTGLQPPGQIPDPT